MSLPWVSVGDGRLTLRGRPSVRALPGLRADGCTHLVTLLSEREGAPLLGDAALAAGVAWIWLPLHGGTPPTGATRDLAIARLAEMRAALDAGGSLLIHCAAGIHRTGMIAYALLRQCGLDREAALVRLGELRDHTRAGVGEHHLAWGDAL